MILNNVNFNNLSLEELKKLIDKYRIHPNSNQLNRNDMLSLIKQYLINKINGYNNNNNKSINLKKTISVPKKNYKKQINTINRTVSHPITSNEKGKAILNHNKGVLYNEQQNKLNNNIIDQKYENINIYPKVNKIIAIGDLHGDLRITLISLKLAEVIPENINTYNFSLDQIKWTGGNTWVVQTGDQIDRCRPDSWNNDCIEDFSEVYDDEGNNMVIMKIFQILDTQARKFGGRVITLLGNHELMNVDKDYRYVSPKEFLEFVPKNERNNKMTSDGYPYGYHHRLKAFQRGGNIANYYSKNKTSIVIIGGWLFVHGGINEELASKYTIQEINNCVSKWLSNTENNTEYDIFDEIFRQDDDISPFWCRIFGDNEEENTVEHFDNVLKILNKRNKLLEPIQGMVIAHTPQYMNNLYLNSLYNNRLWRIDVGMSRAFGEHSMCGPNIYRQIQILIINNNNQFEIKKKPFHGRVPTIGMGENVNLSNPNFL